jgi:hypothetical protein
MHTASRDIFPTQAIQDQFPQVKALLVSDALDQAFLRHDEAANRAKRNYHVLGQIAIALVALSAIFTIAQALILPILLDHIILKYAAVAMAGTGILLQCYLIFTHQKQKWLINRFAAERIRSIKFQAFATAQMAENSDMLESLAQAFISRELAKLENEVNAGMAVLRNFSPAQILKNMKAPARPKNADLANAAREAYGELRVQYQKNFALSEATNFSSRRRVFNSTQDMIYLGAAILTFISLGMKVLGPDIIGMPTGWIDFLAVTFFILGATEAIMDNALLGEQSQARYEQYARDLEEAMASGKLSKDNLYKLVMDVEYICLGELDLFCRAADRISYRF